MFIAEYECAFTRLSKYAKELIADEVDMSIRCEWGLNEEIYVPLLPLHLQEFPILVYRAQRLEEGLSHSKEKIMGKRLAMSSLPPSSFKKSRDFRGSRYLSQVGGPKIKSQTWPSQQTTSMAITGGSGRKSMTHYCSKMLENTLEQSIKSILAQKGNKQSRIVSHVRKEQRPTREKVGRSKSRMPRTYAIWTQEEGDALDVITSEFSLFDTIVIALINLGSIHSYICTLLVREKELPVEFTKQKVIMTNPFRQCKRVNKIYRRCPLKIQECEFLVDLMALSFREFDVILGMDWLSEYGVMVDCKRKRISLRTLDGNGMIVIGENYSTLFNVVSTMEAFKLVRKGHIAYLAYIFNARVSSLKIEEIPMVRE
ncbi:uncharacterized protein LOC108473108 [Gossypium arboreum]|uniref:uncharacterized protein LOC108473108 n=1 Tax=Gossypium arboreum TaxID=29729 RepID=UPI00081977BF|nr:uncharacterized protein LOC108473108 [Gossypium arboreum]